MLNDFGEDTTATADSVQTAELHCLYVADDPAEALRYESVLQEFGISAWSEAGSGEGVERIGIPIFVPADQRENASEVLSAFQAQWDDDDDDDDFDDDDDDDFFPDDVDDDDFEDDDSDDDIDDDD